MIRFDDDFLPKLRNIDSDDDTISMVIDQLSDDYTRGYMSRVYEELSNNYGGLELRDELIDFVRCVI